jgi:hypothetical protein
MKGYKRIDWKPGLWIDWDGVGEPVIRDANNNNKIVATNLMVSEDDVKRLKERFRDEVLDKLLKRDPPADAR